MTLVGEALAKTPPPPQNVAKRVMSMKTFLADESIMGISYEKITENAHLTRK
jgi:hypothetical protein